MNCEGKCAGCPFCSGTAVTERCIHVDVVGSALPASLLRTGADRTAVIRHKGYVIRFVDYTGDDWHIGRKLVESHQDIVLNTVDSTNLEDRLRLATRLIDMNLKAVMVFTRYDELLKTDHSLDFKTLGGLFGFPAAALSGESEEDFSRILSLIVDTYEKPASEFRHIHVPYGKDVDEAIDEITAKIADYPQLGVLHDRYIAVRLLEDPTYVISSFLNIEGGEEITSIAEKASKVLTRQLGEAPEALIRRARHGYIHGALQETLAHSRDNSDHTVLQKIDSLLTSKWLGFPLMILILFGVFEATFTLGAYPQEWIERGISALGTWLLGTLQSGWLSSLLVNGVVQGVGAVIAFLPNIIILFFFLSVLEDTGYMARAAFLMDKIMHRIGLHGRSFVPMLIGFGCNVPAIMAARAIDDRKDRTLTMLMIPFMSCSARLPVYLLFVSAFFAKQKALVMIALYATSIILAILFAFVMKHTRWFRKDQDDYVSELPAFHAPTWRETGHHIWERVADYLKKISTVILAASVVIWALEYFPVEKTNGGELKEESYLAMVGRAAEPVMAPLGFDWKMNVCLITGLPAKEAIVSTMGILYHTEDEGSLAEVMSADPRMTKPLAWAFMLFVLLYFPCIATVATLKREIGRGWAAFTVAHSLALAWVVAFIVYQLGSLLL